MSTDSPPTQPLHTGAVSSDDAPTEQFDMVAPAAPYTPPGRHRLGELGPAESRGALSMADQVVEKIAATALGEIDEIGGSARRMLGVPLGSTEPDQTPRVQAHVAGQRVGLDVAASISYPAPVATVADRARAHVAARLGALTGLQISRVDITVTALSMPAAREGRALL